MTSDAPNSQRSSREIVLIDEEEERWEGVTETTETSPLVGASTRHNATGNDGSRKRQESWIGYEDFVGLPWYRRPSVCRIQLSAKLWSVRRALMLTEGSGLLASRTIFSVHSCIWWRHCTEAEPVSCAATPSLH